MDNDTKHLLAEPFDETAKEFYRQLFVEWGLSVETEREVFFQGRAIDLVVSCPTSEQRQRLQTTVFAHFRRLNALELKGIHDPLTIRDYNKIMMRAWGLGALDADAAAADSSDVDDSETTDHSSVRFPSQRTLTIVVCITNPQKLLKMTHEFHFQPTPTPGIYHCPESLSRWIICPSELELIPANYPLLPLARGKKLAAFIDLCFRQGWLNYIRLILKIGFLADPFTVWQQLLEVQRMDVYEAGQHEAVIPYIERYFQAYPEDLKRLSVTHALLAEQLQQGWQKGQQEGMLQQTRKLLLRQLRLKFPSVPNVVAQRIEMTTNVEQLETWLTQVMMANSLTETELGRMSH